MDDHGHGTGNLDFDSGAPLKGTIVCCTGISPEERQKIVTRTAELGGIHRFDLTPDVTHLLVSDYETEKYRHVARDRSDVKAMDPGWIEALNKLWTQDEPIDFSAEEKRWQLRPLECAGASDATASNPNPTRRRLLICLTGFNDVTERSALQDRISANGGVYTPDLTRQCSHLVVAKPEGKKYKAAKNWKLKTVSVEWLIQSTERGMILDEKYFDPTLPAEDRGKGAYVTADVSVSKRPRPVDSFAESEGRLRKLRKTASMKLTSQRNSFLGDLLAQKPQAQSAVQKDDWEDISVAVHNAEADDAVAERPTVDQAPPPPPPGEKKGIFSTSYFYIHGFEKPKDDIVSDAIKTRDGRVCRDADEVKRARAPRYPWYRFIVVPQETRPESLDFEDDGIEPVQVVTEFFIEKCMLHNRLFDPEHHVLGRPFTTFPIPGFEKFVVCSAGFAGLDLHHFAQVISQLGGRFEETFRASTSLLICKSIASIRDVKKKFAIDNGIPIVREDWLWASISTGTLAPIEKFMFPELRQKIPEKQLPNKTLSEPTGPVSGTKKPKKRDPPLSLAHDTGSGGSDEGSAMGSRTAKTTSDSSSRYETARTNLNDSREGIPTNRTLKEVSANSVSRSESPVSNMSKDSSDDKSRSENNKDGEKKRQLEEEKRRAEEKRAREEQERRRKAEEEEEERRKAEEAEEQRRKDEELLGFQSRVTSLIERRSGSASGSEDNTLVDRPPAPAKKERRKRGIFGRAVSSVSVTSNLSSSDYRERERERERERDSELLDDNETQQQEENSMLTMTQVEYRDPEAIEARDGILKRMNEGKGPVRSSGRLRKTPGRLL